MNRAKAIAFSVAAVSAALLAYLFLFGKLFPYSPVAVGFDRHEFGRVSVYTEKGALFQRLGEIEAWISPVEDFHGLKFKKKPRIFLFGDGKTYAGRSPSRARFSALYNGDIVVSPWAQKEAAEGLISMETYLRHELSHALLYQHAGLLGAFRYPKWLLEGVAVYSASQMGTGWYPSKEQTYRYIRDGDFMPPGHFGTEREEGVMIAARPRSAFIYCEFACIVDYLVARHGRDRFLAYMKGLLEGGDHDAVFQTVYRAGFDRTVEDFRRAVREAEDAAGA